MLGIAAREAAKALGYSILASAFFFAITFNRDIASNGFCLLLLISALTVALNFTSRWGRKGFFAFLVAYCIPALGLLVALGALLVANADRHFGWECSGHSLTHARLSLACRR